MHMVRPDLEWAEAVQLSHSEVIQKAFVDIDTLC